MGSPQNNEPAAFGDILAGLGGRGDRFGAKTAAPSRPASPAATLDASWVQSARLRASAAQMAQRVAAPAVEITLEGPAQAGRRTQAPASLYRGDPPVEPTAPVEPDFAKPARDRAAPVNEGAAAAYSPDQPSAAATHQPAPAPKPPRNAVRAVRRMLARFAAGWRVGAGKAPSHKVKDKPKTSRVRKIKVKAKHWANAKAQDRPPASSPPTEDQRIADELGLRADLGIGELRRIRRDFAKRNHPDRFEPAQRLGAARRMTIANMLIDAHMKQKPPL